mgnify:CR=1 FL=1
MEELFLRALLAGACLILGPPALAQDAEESPAAEQEAPAAETQAEGIVFPVMLGGQLLSPDTYSGAEWLELFTGERLLSSPVEEAVLVLSDAAEVDAFFALASKVGPAAQEIAVQRLDAEALCVHGHADQPRTVAAEELGRPVVGRLFDQHDISRPA